MDWFLYDRDLRHERVKNLIDFSLQLKAYYFDSLVLYLLPFLKAFPEPS